MKLEQKSVESTDRVTIDAEELIMALQSHHGEIDQYLDRSTGEIVFLGDEDVVEEQEEWRSLIEDDDSDRFVYIQPIPSSAGFQIMADFIEEQTSGNIQEKLIRAVRGSHPFRRFKDELLNYPSVRQDWFTFQNRRILVLAREWMKDESIEGELKTREA